MSKNINTVEQAFEKMNIAPNTKPVITGIPEQYVPALEKVFESLVISDAVRDGWEPDYDNRSEYKYESWFWVDNPSGFRFDASFSRARARARARFSAHSIPNRRAPKRKSLLS